MFTGVEHKFAVQEHVFTVREHKFNALEHKTYFVTSAFSLRKAGKPCVYHLTNVIIGRIRN